MTNAEWARTDTQIEQSVANYYTQPKAEVMAEKTRKDDLRKESRSRIDMEIEALLQEAREEREKILMRVSPTSAREALKIVAEEFGVTTEEIYGTCREARFVLPRHVIGAYLSAHEWTSCRIARLLQRHHSTILHGAKALKAKRAADPVLEARVTSLYGRLACRQEEVKA